MGSCFEQCVSVTNYYDYFNQTMIIRLLEYNLLYKVIRYVETGLMADNFSQYSDSVLLFMVKSSFGKVSAAT